MAIKNILFDFDGTLADTSQLVMDSWQHTFVTVTGKRADERTIYRTYGERLINSMARLLPGHDPEKLVGIYRDYQLSLGDKVWKLIDGMGTLVDVLQDHGMKLGIVTSRTGASTMHALEYFGMEDTFHTVVTCDDTHIHKPEPEPALIGLDRLSADPKETLFIGDTLYDIGCAHNAGIRAVLVTWTPCMDEEDKVGIYKPDFEIAKPLELLEVIRQC